MATDDYIEDAWQDGYEFGRKEALAEMTLPGPPAGMNPVSTYIVRWDSTKREYVWEDLGPEVDRGESVAACVAPTVEEMR